MNGLPPLTAREGSLRVNSQNRQRRNLTHLPTGTPIEFLAVFCGHTATSVTITNPEQTRFLRACVTVGPAYPL